jgi:hypothetical protein
MTDSQPPTHFFLAIKCEWQHSIARAYENTIPVSGSLGGHPKPAIAEPMTPIDLISCLVSDD